jgi:hypothetical protein
MAMGKRKRRQEALFVMAEELPKSAGHPFYQRLNQLLAEARFDEWVERRCQQYYAPEEKRGQPSIPPGLYFRMLLVGYFENLSQPTRHRLAVRRQPVAARLPGCSFKRDYARSFDAHPHSEATAAGGVRRGVSIRALCCRKEEAHQR